MKKGIKAILFSAALTLPISFAFAFTDNPEAESPEYATCLKWKEVCYNKVFCTQRESLRTGPYRCVKPGRYGFHIYPREMERITNNPDTADYLRAMGYRCYQEYGSSPCLQERSQQICDSKCVEYPKPAANASQNS
ncbi:MAG: hypothetical protein NTZ67_05785 [Gammaproteobacteria bacterium]|nr:hypothetical protein [Gammaproteobacteria bacterium]